MQLDELVNSHVGEYARQYAVSSETCAEMEGCTMIMVRQVGRGRLGELRGAAAGSSCPPSGWPTIQKLSTWSALFLPGRIAGKKRYACIVLSA